MKLSRNLQGEELALHLERRWGYVRISQNGSHIKLRTETPAGQTVIVPAHRPVRIGTLQSILRQVAAHKQVSTKVLLEGM